MYEINDRIQLNDGLATIKYIGAIDVWEKALGIEWDQPDRGKNDGNIGNKRYFVPSIKSSASFIKPNNKKIIPRRSLEEALDEYYGSDRSFGTIQFGSKMVESFGFEKLNKLNSRFDNLTSVSLDKRSIFKSSKINLPKLAKLDLSYNLFNDFNEIWEILDQLPTLKELNLNGNRFFNTSKSKTSKYNLSVLKLADTKINFNDLNVILGHFNLKQLILAGNNYKDLDLGNLPNLEDLDLSYNNLTVVPSYNATSINLSENLIQEIIPGKYNYKQLDIRHNKIYSWKFIDALYENFQLLSLKITDNPIFKNMDDEEMSINLISRLDCNLLKELNGSNLDDDEITNAELYFINKVKIGDYEKPATWGILQSKYNVEEDTHVNKFNDFYYKKMKLIIHVNNNQVQKLVLNDYSVLKIKGIVSSIINMSILNIELYYYLNDEIKEELEDILRLEDYNFQDSQDIYVNIIS